MSSCPICGANQSYVQRHLYDDRYGYQGHFPLAACPRCGHQFLAQTFSPAEIVAMYTDFYPRTHYHAAEIQALKPQRGWKGWFNGHLWAYSFVPPQVRVLDIGCGFGETVAYHQARGCDAFGVEADKNVGPLAEKSHLKVHIGTFDANLYEASSFDYVTMDQVLEHLTNPAQTLQDIYRILKPGGYLALTTPHGRGWGARLFGSKWINWHAPYHLHHFSKDSLRRLADQVGFQIKTLKTFTSSEWLYYQEVHFLHYPKQGEPSHQWAPQRAPNQLSKPWRGLVRLLSKIHFLKINHLITRLFDALGWGDNMVVLLRKP